MPLLIEHYTDDRIPNPYPDGSLPWQVYQAVRNAIVRTCRKHGPTGPMGECPLDAPVRSPYGLRGAWPLGDDPCVFFVVDDQYNDERYIYLEVCREEQFTEHWLYNLSDALRDFPGWGIGIKNLNLAYILVFEDRLMVTGPIFEECEDVPSVVRAARKVLNCYDPEDREDRDDAD
ncbi:MAG: hypothetical protein HY000_26490 [Planctomycetes bacterium]|nr:hypothetical protein [Planctomycetota bacterium]